MSIAFKRLLFGLIGVSSCIAIAFNAIAQPRQIEAEYLTISDGLSTTSVRDVIQDSFGLIWIATINGLQKYDGYSFETFKSDANNPASLQHNRTSGLVEDRDNNIWVTTGTGISRYDRQRNQFVNYVFADRFELPAGAGRAFEIIMDSKGVLWATTFDLGVLMYNQAEDKWEQPPYDLPTTEDLLFDFALGLTTDASGGLWSGSENYGLLHMPAGSDKFRPINFDGNNPFSIASDESKRITFLYADENDMLWITTRKGVYKYNHSNQEIKTIREYEEGAGQGNNFYNCIRQDHEGNIWIANNFRGILKFEGLSDEYDELSLDGSVWMQGYGWDIALSNFMIDHSGIFWFASLTNGIVKYDPITQPFSLYEVNEDPTGLNGNGVFGILASKQKPGVVYVGTRGGGLNVIDPQTDIIKKYNYEAVDDVFEGSVRSIAENPDGSLWLGTWGDGLLRLDKELNEIARYKSVPDDPTTISNNQVRVIRHDGEGMLWVGTNDGLNKIDPSTDKIKRIASRSTIGYPTQLVDQMMALLKSEQRLGVIDTVSDAKSLSQEIVVEEAGTYFVISVGEGDPVSMADYGWLEDENQERVWEFGDFISSYHAGGSAKNRVSIDAITLQPGKYTLWYQSDGSHSYNLWNAPAPTIDFYGIALVAPEDPAQIELVRNLSNQDLNEPALSGSNITDIEITDQYVWVIANGSGLNRIDLTTNTIKYYLPGKDKNTVSSGVILDICIDSQGMLWLATNEGINKFDPQTENFTLYAESDGLPTNLTEVIVEGDNGEMWIATQNGLSQMVTNNSLNKVTFINYNSSDGIGGDTFLSLAGTRATDGKYYFGGDHGVTTFSSIIVNDTPPDLIISDILVSNMSIKNMGDESPLTKSLLNTESIQLSYDQNNLSFEFAALHYANPEKNQYAHILKGYEDDWTYDNRNFASYTNLDPGEYEFVIRASNAYGVWNEEGKSLKVKILPPWWQTWWAYALYVIILLSLIYTIVSVRSYYLRKENRILEERVEHRTAQLNKTIEELKTTQSQLIQSEKMASLGELTAGIAHEIQNPLNFVNNFSDVSSELIDEMNEELDNNDIEEAKLIAADIKKNLEKISHHGKRADDIVKSMLQHSRAGSGVKELTDINLLADEYLRLAYHGLRAKDKAFNSDFKVELDDNLPKIDVVAQDIGRVLLNLINNAFHAVSDKARNSSNALQSANSGTSNRDTSSGPEQKYSPLVNVWTRKRGPNLEIGVKDNGNGIPQEIRDKIYQPFFTTKPTGEGTGLGLSMSYDIITKGHNGRIDFISIPGEGTEFTILLPINLPA